MAKVDGRFFKRGRIDMDDITKEDYLLIIDGSSLLTTQFYGTLPKEIMFAKTLEEKERYFDRIMQTTNGTYTNAVYGFLRVLLKVMKEQHPAYLAVTWDLSRDTFRREMYADYKKNRAETLPPLKDQFILCQEILKDMEVSQFMDNRYEADDFSGTLSMMFEEKIPVRIITKDNDYLQLVSERTNLWMIHSTSQKTEELYQKYNLNQKKLNTPDRTFPFTPELVKKEFGVEPESINSLKGLQGDPSDNIKGVPGIGSATAAALIGKYKSVEALYDTIRPLDENAKKKLAQQWKTELGLKRSPMNYLLKTSTTELVGEQAAKLSKQLATIKRDIPLPEVSLESLKTKINKEKAKEWFDKLEFKSLKFPEEEEEWISVSENEFFENPFLEIEGESVQKKKAKSFEECMNPPEVSKEQQTQDTKKPKELKITSFLYRKECVFLIETKQQAEECIEKLIKKSKELEYEEISFFTKNQAGTTFALYPIAEETHFYGLCIAIRTGEFYYFVINKEITEEYINEKLSNLLTPNCSAACYQLKELYQILPSLYGKKRIFDIKVAAYLLNPLQGTYPLQQLQTQYQQFLPEEEKIGIEQSIFSPEMIPLLGLQKEEGCRAACIACAVVGGFAELFTKKLADQEMLHLFETIEMPLVETLYDMQQRGIRVKREALNEYARELSVGICALEQEIYTLAGEEFNINSPRQLGVILFERLKLPNGKKTKTGYSTSAECLEQIAQKHPIVPKILEYRQLAKLKSTYADGLAGYIGPDERIHGKFHQTIAATGRISSTDPNLQNIPIRLPLGRQIRKVFVPEEGYVFLDADYSQIELRVLAHLSKDERLQGAYRIGEDIHKITASQVFHIPLDQVTKEQRSNAKAVNFGIVYGISSFGLGMGLNISTKEAEHYIHQYFETYPKVKTFLEELIRQARENGYVSTMFQRRRPMSDLSNENFRKRSAQERIAMNSPIQGTAADIIKIAMIQVNERLKREKFQSRLLLQIHDELLVETAKEEIESVKQILLEEMQNAVELSIPLEVEVKQGSDWYEAK